MAGCPRTLVLDQDDLINPSEKNSERVETEGSGATPLAPSYMQRIVDKLKGTLEPAGGHDINPRELEDSQEHLTRRQKILLDATRSLPHVRFTGGAGSGKTWLAVEKARLLSRSGQRVGLFCYNKGLGQYLQDQVSQWRQAKPVFTSEFHEYMKSLGVPNGSGQAYLDEEMPRLFKELATELPLEQKFDAVIVDEAQDFAPLWWEALLACLKDPESGQVYAFG